MKRLTRIAAAATVEGHPLSVDASPTITIATNKPFYEFLGEDISVTLAVLNELVRNPKAADVSRVDPTVSRKLENRAAKPSGSSASGRPICARRRRATR